MNRAKKLGILSGVLIAACLAALIALHTDEKRRRSKPAVKPFYPLSLRR